MSYRTDRAMTLVELAVTIVIAGIVLLPMSYFAVTMVKASQKATERMALSSRVLTATNGLQFDLMNAYRVEVTELNLQEAIYYLLDPVMTIGQLESQRIHCVSGDGRVLSIYVNVDGDLVADTYDVLLGGTLLAVENILDATQLDLSALKLDLSSSRLLARNVVDFMARVVDDNQIEVLLEVRQNARSEATVTARTSVPVLNHTS